MSLLKKHAASTPGTGMADDVPATINGTNPAALSEGEFVIDAQTVAMIGDGNSDAGAAILKKMVQDIRKLKQGHSKQPLPIASLIKNAKSGKSKTS